MSHSHQLTENSILGGRYRIVKVLGEGGFGITYEGYDTLFNVKVAIKEYYPIGLVNRTVTETTEVTAFTRENEVIFERGKSSFLKEAKTLARFASNPNIVSVKDFFELNNTVYMVMELLEGTDVKGFLKYNGKMSFEDTFTLLRPVMEALSQVHAAGLIHRDISPDNIMITQDGTTKLLDFGAAREMSADGEKSLSILLKPGFAPQEQYTKKGQQGPWTDVYALCATMYKMMTLQTPDDAMSRVFEDELENIRKYNPSVSEEECAVILNGMAVKIEDRYQSIGELIRGCEEAIKKISNNLDCQNDTASNLVDVIDYKNTSKTLNSVHHKNRIIDNKNNTKIYISIAFTISFVVMLGFCFLVIKQKNNTITQENNVKDTELTEKEKSSEDVSSEYDKTEQETTSDNNIDAEIEKIISRMSVHDKVCQMFIVTPESLTGIGQVTEAGNATKECYKQNPVGGLIYFSQNLESTDQTNMMLSNMQHYGTELSGFPIFLAVDEEGGTVAICEEKLGAPKLSDMYNYKSEGTETAYNNAATIAGYLKGYGFNLDFAPVADTWTNPSNTVIGTRAYSDDYNEASVLVASAVKGFKDNGIACTLKYFPGYGDTDSYTTSKSIEEMQYEEFLPFKSGIEEDADMVMVGHIIVTSENSEPAIISKKIVTDILRNSLGYNGVVITDALDKGDVSNIYSSSELCIKCINAGVDIMLMPTDFKSAVSGLESAIESGQISESRIDESLRRILKVKLSLYETD